MNNKETHKVLDTTDNEFGGNTEGVFFIIPREIFN